MSKQQLNLATVPGIQEISDRAAEIYTAGAFVANGVFEWNVGAGAIEDINIAGANGLDVRNIDWNSGNPNATGHDFGVEYLDANGNRLGTENIEYGRGVLRFNEFQNAGATTARVTQYICFC